MKSLKVAIPPDNPISVHTKFKTEGRRSTLLATKENEPIHTEFGDGGFFRLAFIIALS